MKILQLEYSLEILGWTGEFSLGLQMPLGEKHFFCCWLNKLKILYTNKECWVFEEIPKQLLECLHLCSKTPQVYVWKQIFVLPTKFSLLDTWSYSQCRRTQQKGTETQSSCRTFPVLCCASLPEVCNLIFHDICDEMYEHSQKIPSFPKPCKQENWSWGVLLFDEPTKSNVYCSKTCLCSFRQGGGGWEVKHFVAA